MRSLLFHMSSRSRPPSSPSLPLRDGVAPSYVWLPNGPWKSVGDFFSHRFPQVSAASWINRMSRGEVRDENALALSLESPFRTGACVFYYREPEDETRIPFDATIVYQDDEILIADKPHFLPVIPGGRFLHETLLVRLKKETGLSALVPIHRLDRETAGLVMFSVNPATRDTWQSLFRERAVNKIYEAHADFNEALVFPHVHRSRLIKDQAFFRMREADGLPNSETLIHLDKHESTHTRYLLQPITGKMHQLRVHMLALGLPILNDALYPVAKPANSDDFSAPLKLLARSISFKDPLTGQSRFFESLRSLYD